MSSGNAVEEYLKEQNNRLQFRIFLLVFGLSKFLGMLNVFMLHVPTQTVFEKKFFSLHQLILLTKHRPLIVTTFYLKALEDLSILALGCN